MLLTALLLTGVGIRSTDYFGGVLPFLAVVNNAAMNLNVQISVSVPVFNYFVFIPRSGIVNSVIILCLTF